MIVIICYLIMTILLSVNLGFTIREGIVINQQIRRIDKLERKLNRLEDKNQNG